MKRRPARRSVPRVEAEVTAGHMRALRQLQAELGVPTMAEAIRVAILFALPMVREVRRGGKLSVSRANGTSCELLLPVLASEVAA